MYCTKLSMKSFARSTQFASEIEVAFLTNWTTKQRGGSKAALARELEVLQRNCHGKKRELAGVAPQV